MFLGVTTNEKMNVGKYPHMQKKGCGKHAKLDSPFK